MRNRLVPLVAFLIITGVVFCSRWPVYQARRAVEKQNTTVTLALDFEDVYAAAAGDRSQVRRHLEYLKRVPVAVLALSEKADSADERLVRASGFSILWQIQTTDYVELQRVLGRLEKGDAVMSTEKQAAGFPMYVGQVAAAMRAKEAFLPVFEFLPQKGLSSLAGKLDGALIKAHLLGDREVFSPRLVLWKKRFLRAARERGVRFFYLRMSPARSWEDNRTFLDQLAVLFAAEHFTVGKPQPFKGWGGGKAPARAAIVLAVIAPLLGLWLIGFKKSWGVAPRYLLFCSLSAWTGVCIYLMGSSEKLVLGLAALSGVKIQLLLPLVIAVFLIWNSGWKKRLETNIKAKHVIFAGGVLGVLTALYLMRSGNFPLIPVSDTERHFRDGLESFLGARPRFKEFFIGHPALITAFYCQTKKLEARPWLLVGLIGQISIVNTFLHFHVPLELGLLRTFNGVWIGALLSVPLCLWMKARAAQS